jgi:hypothetical protein
VNEAKHSLLLLIPAYNEERRIAPVLREYAEYYAQEFPGRFEIFVVLNGCRDNTLGVVQEMAREFPFIGSRWLPESVLHQSQTKVRRFISRGFHYIVEGLFWMGIKDTQCPAKLLQRDAVQKIHSHLRIADFAFDVNLLYSLKHAGLKVVEMPIEWTDKIGSKVTQSLMRSSVVMALSVVRLRLIYSPLYNWLQPLRPLEAWLYKKLRAPLPPQAPLPRNAAFAPLQPASVQRPPH